MRLGSRRPKHSFFHGVQHATVGMTHVSCQTGVREFFQNNGERIDRMISPRVLLCISAVGLAVEVAWVVGEATIVPYLWAHNVHASVAGMVFAVNPSIGFFIQPTLGAWSDRCQTPLGRRRPFIIGLGLVGLVGLFILICAEQWYHHIPQTAFISIVFVAYGLCELSHDCLFMFGRLLLGDYVPHEEKQRAYSVFTRCELLGRLTALVLGSFAIESFLPPLFDTYSHIRYLFLITAVVLAACISAVTFGISEADRPKGLLETEMLAIAASSHKEEYEPFVDEENQSESGDETASLNHGHGNGHGNGHGQGTLKVQVPSNSHSHFATPSLQSPNSSKQINLRSSFLFLAAVHFMCNMGLLLLGFYWTSFIGEEVTFGQSGIRVAYVGLALQAFVGVLTTMILPPMNDLLGTTNVYYGAQLILAIALFEAGISNEKEERFLSTMMIAATGYSYAVVMNNPFVLAEKLLEGHQVEEKRGIYVGLVSNAMPLAQIFVGAIAGVFVERVGVGQVFAHMGVICLTASLILMFCDKYFELLPYPQPTRLRIE